MNIDEQLKQILKFGEGNTFFSFANADGKRWIMPARNMQTAMNLYQPSGPKGKLVKVGLPLLYWNPAALRVLHAERLRLSLTDEMRKLLEKTFGITNPEFAIFCGTPCVHQKITIQISSGSRIIGYVKVTASEDIRAVFGHENHILTTLHRQGIECVPECLYCGTLNGGLHVFIQTTTKTAQSKVMHGWTNLHSLFLTMLAVRTQQELPFEQTDFNHDLNLLESRLSEFDETEVVENAITEVRSHYEGKNVAFSAFQADFTPWNMFEERGELFVFDWEYARLTYPPRLDYFHFMIQTAIFEEHQTAEDIAKRFEAERDVLDITYRDSRLALKCYLLAIMSIYINREKESIGNDTRGRIAFWVKLLKLIG